MTDEIGEQDFLDIGALADGTLPAERRDDIMARVEASPVLQEALERQERSIRATDSLAGDRPPASLVESVQAPARARPARNRAVMFLPWVAAAVVVLIPILVLVVLRVGGSAEPSALTAAAFALRPATGPAPAAGGPSQLAAHVDGIAFPDLADAFGWQATGVRHGSIGSHKATTVYYQKDQRQIAYVIVNGSPLVPANDAIPAIVGGVRFYKFGMSNRYAVSWEQSGHTCVLIGSVSHDELIALAGWAGSRSVY